MAALLIQVAHVLNDVVGNHYVKIAILEGKRDTIDYMKSITISQ